MITEELVGYVRQQAKEGLTKEEISGILTANGWDMKDVDEAFDLVGGFFPEQGGQSMENHVNTSEEHTSLESENSERKDTYANSPNIISKSATVSSGGKSNKSIFFIIILLFIIILGAGGAYAYNKFIKRPTPYQVILGMLEKDFSSILSNEFINDINFNFNISEGVGEKIASFRTDIKSSGAKVFSEDKVTDFKMKNTVDFSGEYSLYSLDFDVDWDLILKDGIIYIKLNDASKIPGMNLSAIKDRWISVADVSDGISGIAKQFDPYHPASLLDEKEITKREKRIKEEFSLKYIEFLKSDEAKDIIDRSFVEGGDKKINDISVYHYVVRFSKEDLKVILTQVIDMITEVSGLDDDDREEMQEIMASEEFETFLDILANSNMEIWIGKKDFLPYKTFFDWQFVNKKFPNPFDPDPFGVDASVSRKSKDDVLKASLAQMRARGAIYYENNSNYGNATDLGICSTDVSNNTMFSSDYMLETIQSIGDFNGNNIYCVAVGDNGKAEKFAISALFENNSKSFCADYAGFYGLGRAGDTGECVADDDVSVSIDINKKEISVDGGLTVTYSSSNYNKLVEVDVPTNIMSIEEAMNAIYGGDLMTEDEELLSF